MDDLKQYTQCSWFLDLNILQLKELYKQLEDLWNYRINMTINEKKRYVKNGILFADKVQVINKVNSKIKLGNILLDNFEKFDYRRQTVSSVQLVLFGYYPDLLLLINTHRMLFHGCISLHIQVNNIIYTIYIICNQMLSFSY